MAAWILANSEPQFIMFVDEPMAWCPVVRCRGSAGVSLSSATLDSMAFTGLMVYELYGDGDAEVCGRIFALVKFVDRWLLSELDQVLCSSAVRPLLTPCDSKKKKFHKNNSNSLKSVLKK